MIKPDEIIKVGRFQKTHALKGELNMISDIDSEYFEEGNPLIVEYDGLLVPYFVESIRPKGSTSYLVKISGIDSENEASHFVNNEIFILKKDAEERLDKELSDSYELEGYSVMDVNSNMVLGEIERLEDSTANLLFIIKNANEDEIIVPATEDFIEDIDKENKIIKMILPQGLIDLNKKE